MVLVEKSHGHLAILGCRISRKGQRREDFIIELFCQVDDVMKDVQKHSQASLHPSEVVTLAWLFALKGVGTQAFYQWLIRDYSKLFPKLLERTRLFRAFNRHRVYTQRFMAAPSLIGLLASYSIELIHPHREGPSIRQIGRKGTSNLRWIVGGKLAVLLNHLGLVVTWDCATANVYDGSAFQHLVDAVADPHFAKMDWQPTNLKLCKRGQFNTRMLVETMLSMLTVVCDF